MIENTGFVVKPYFFYPELLSIIRNLVQSEPVSHIKDLVFKLIGTLGAVDPYLINQIKYYHKQKNANEDDEMLNNIPQMLGIEPDMMKSDGMELDDSRPDSQEVKIVLDINRPLPDEYAADLGLANTALESTLKRYNITKPEINKQNKYSMIAMESLIKILNDRTLVDHHKTVLNNIKYLVQQIGKDFEQFFPLVIPSILNCISTENQDQLGQVPFYQCLKCIIDNVPSVIKSYQNMIFDTIERVINSASRENNLLYAIELLKHINMRSEEAYLPQMNFILPKVLQLLDYKRMMIQYSTP